MSDLRRVTSRLARGYKLIDFYRGKRMVGYVQKAARGVWISCVFVGDGRTRVHRRLHRAIEAVERKA